ncbi:unnamed protein product [Gulo gulo]|uniref:Uncharacterized protein n=1 Tax=Gulo gulo TaxID=48420 RepID=A0A9X9M8B9_GULGU|nr:unnamed protein product [Gulo gulo]
MKPFVSQAWASLGGLPRLLSPPIHPTLDCLSPLPTQPYSVSGKRFYPDLRVLILSLTH